MASLESLLLGPPSARSRRPTARRGGRVLVISSTFRGMSNPSWKPTSLICRSDLFPLLLECSMPFHTSLSPSLGTWAELSARQTASAEPQPCLVRQPLNALGPGSWGPLGQTIPPSPQPVPSTRRPLWESAQRLRVGRGALDPHCPICVKRNSPGRNPHPPSWNPGFILILAS